MDTGDPVYNVLSLTVQDGSSEGSKPTCNDEIFRNRPEQNIYEHVANRLALQPLLLLM